MAVDPLIRQMERQAAPLLPPGAGVVVAVSGGADSLALLHLLAAAGLLAQRPVLVAHFDHALRPESAAEGEQVAQQAAALGLPCQRGRWESPPDEAGNLAAQARAARYRFLGKAALAVGATRVATGHHLDDQAETVLERLLRGSGVTGLGAMRPAAPLPEWPGPGAPLLVRPLLGCRRAALRDWLAQRGTPWVEDPGNRDPARRRSRIRHRLLPALADGDRTDPAPALADTAHRLQQAECALAWSLERVWPELDPRLEAGRASLALPPLQALPEELARRALLRLHHHLTGGPPPNARGQQQLLARLGAAEKGWRMRLRGVRVMRHEGRVVLEIAPGGPAKGTAAVEL